MVVYRGVIRDKMVVFEGPVDLADGVEVEVRPVVAIGDDADEAAREEAFKQHLVEAGLLDRIRRPQPDPPDMDRTPIPILAGPPVSQTLIEDRP